MKVLITGATGFIGKPLVRALSAEGHSIVVLTSKPGTASAVLPPPIEIFPWKAESELPPQKALQGVSAVFHLAGENIAAKRWTKAQKEKIRSSRVEGTKNLVKAVSQMPRKPTFFLLASAVGYYGNRGSENLTEQSTAGTSFLAEVCSQWEAALKSEPLPTTRKVRVRNGVVLGPGGGVLKKLLFPFKMGLGGKIGSGTQYMSWIHIDDLVALYLHLMKKPTLQGPVNGVAPTAVTNQEFTKALGSALKRPTPFPMPAAIARLMLGEIADELLLSSQKVQPKTAQESGFSFKYPTISEALAAALKS